MEEEGSEQQTEPVNTHHLTTADYIAVWLLAVNVLKGLVVLRLNLCSVYEGSQVLGSRAEEFLVQAYSLRVSGFREIELGRHCTRNPEPRFPLSFRV